MKNAQDGSATGLPSVDNQTFLRALFGNSWYRAHVTGFAGDPGDPALPRAAWEGGAAGTWQLRPGENNYFTVSLFTGSARRKGAFEALHVLGVDDVGPKVDPGTVRALLGEPTYRLATSPGNEQWGYALAEPIRNEATASLMIETLIRKLVGDAPDPGMAGVTRYLRLPVGMNLKKALGPDGFRVRLLEWAPARRISAQLAVLVPTEVAGRHHHGGGGGARVSPVGASTSRWDQVAEGDTLLKAMRQLGLVLGQPRTSDMGRGYDVICPWVDEHTERATTGTFYSPQHGFQCHHGHCRDRTAEHLRPRLDELLRSESGGLVGVTDVEFPDFTEGEVDALAAREQSSAGTETVERALARRFVDLHGAHLRFDHTRGRWFRWGGRIWREDVTGEVHDLVSYFTEKVRRGGGPRTLGQLKTISAVERLARGDRRVAVGQGVWNTNPWLLATPEGVFDLRTGEQLASEPTQMITRMTSVAPAPRGTPAPVWDQFIWDATGGDPGLITMLYQWFGYSLSGDTSAEVCVFLYGPGGNGKGVALHTMSTVAGDHAAHMSSAVFMHQDSPRHLSEIARLDGVRMAIASEIADDRRFNLAQLKSLVSMEGKLDANFMRQDRFNFTPQHKITLVGNHKPHIPHVNEAIARRLLLVPFEHRPAQVNPKLKDQLIAEYPAILRRLIDGCAEVYQTLHVAKQSFAALVPPSVADASRQYLSDESSLLRWMVERLVASPGTRTLLVSGAFEDYQRWCGEGSHNMDVVSERTMKDGMLSAAAILGVAIQFVKMGRGMTLIGWKLAEIR